MEPTDAAVVDPDNHRDTRIASPWYCHPDGGRPVVCLCGSSGVTIEDGVGDGGGDTKRRSIGDETLINAMIDCRHGSR